MLINPNAFRSLPWVMCTKILGLLFGGLLSVILVRHLSKEEFGVYSLYLNLGESLAIIGQAGMQIAISRFLPPLFFKHHLASVANLLLRTTLYQLIAWFLLSLGLACFFALYSDVIFKDFKISVTIASLLSLVFITREHFGKIYTAIYHLKEISLLSFFYFALFFLIIFFIRENLNVFYVLYTQISLLALYALAASILVFFILQKQSQGTHENRFISNQRLFRLTLPAGVNAVLLLLRSRYTEVFFIGYFFGTEQIGIYTLAYFIAYYLISMVPQSFKNLFTSIFSESYSDNPRQLGKLIIGLNKIVIFLCLPITCAGFLYAPSAVVLLYGSAMQEAGVLASLLCPLEFALLISVPLSIGVIVKEKNLEALPLSFSTIVINITFDYFLIKHYGLAGAISAVALTFLLTLPIRLFIIKRLIGGIFFPLVFFIKYTLICALTGILLFAAISHHHWTGLLLSLCLYPFLLLFLLKFSRMIHQDDIEEFVLFEMPLLTKLARFVAR